METVQQRFQLEPLNWREEGRVAGEAKGRAAGKIEGKEEAARKMFVKGFSFEDIQDITGFNTEILEKIRLSISK
jgi:predicted transposase/invertase (TIGR01784 family)